MDQLLNYNLLELVSSDWADRVAEGLLETTSLPHKGRGKVPGLTGGITMDMLLDCANR